MICKLVIHTHPYPLYVDPTNCHLNICEEMGGGYSVGLTCSDASFYIFFHALPEAVAEADRIMHVVNGDIEI